MQLIEIRVLPFNFIGLVKAHGWVNLAPFSWREEDACLIRPLMSRHDELIHTEIRVITNRRESVVHVSLAKRLHKGEIQDLESKILRMLCLRLDYSEFHSLCKNDPNLRFVHDEKFGGLLRGETLFEDLIKTVCTTNCDWRNTKKMCEALCQINHGCFPTPKMLLEFSEKKLSCKAPVGYRARTILEISRLIADEALPLEEWAEDGNYGLIKERLRCIWGLGTYSIAHILVLLGCYEEIPVDSEYLKYISTTHYGGREISIEEATRPYENYGKYKFLAYKHERIGRKRNYIDK